MLTAVGQKSRKIEATERKGYKNCYGRNEKSR